MCIEQNAHLCQNKNKKKCEKDTKNRNLIFTFRTLCCNIYLNKSIVLRNFTENHLMFWKF